MLLLIHVKMVGSVGLQYVCYEIRQNILSIQTTPTTPLASWILANVSTCNWQEVAARDLLTPFTATACRLFFFFISV